MADGRREGDLPRLREDAQGRRSRTSASTRDCLAGRSTSSFPSCVAYADVSDVGKAAKDWPQLNFIIYHWRLPPRRRRPEGGARGVQPHRPRSRGPATSPRSRSSTASRNVYADVGQLFATDAGRRAERVRRAHGHADPRPRRRSRLLGHRRGVDRLAAMADRRPAPARDSGGDAEAARLQAARRRDRSGQDRHLRRQQRPPLQHRPAARRARRWRAITSRRSSSPTNTPARAFQPPLRLRDRPIDPAVFA